MEASVVVFIVSSMVGVTILQMIGEELWRKLKHLLQLGVQSRRKKAQASVAE